jgi:hypothetical protein
VRKWMPLHTRASMTSLRASENRSSASINPEREDD